MMSDKKHTGRGIFGKGDDIALILCAAAIGITGYLYYRNANDQDTQLQEPPAEQTVAATYGNEDVPYWPQNNNATFREVWVGSASRWLMLCADCIK